MVDDGSKDRTLEVLHQAFDGERARTHFHAAEPGQIGRVEPWHPRVRSTTSWSRWTRTPSSSKGAIATAGAAFLRPEGGAVSGNARVGNRKKLITRFQSIEYICGFNLDRRALDLLNAITVVPGAVGAWRKDLSWAWAGSGTTRWPKIPT